MASFDFACPELDEGLRTNRNLVSQPFVLSVAERQRSEVEGPYLAARAGLGRSAAQSHLAPFMPPLTQSAALTPSGGFTHSALNSTTSLTTISPLASSHSA